MLNHTQEIYNEAILLSPSERIEIIENLFYSLDSKSDRGKIDKLWAVEAEDRLDAYEKGEIESISATEVFKKINSVRK